jgi:hypothetical protein
VTLRDVRQHVDPLVGAVQLLRQLPDACHQRQVGDIGVDGGASPGRLRLARDCVDALGLAADDCDLRALPGQFDRRSSSNPARRAGDHDQRHGRDSTTRRYAATGSARCPGRSPG